MAGCVVLCVVLNDVCNWKIKITFFISLGGVTSKPAGAVPENNGSTLQKAEKLTFIVMPDPMCIYSKLSRVHSLRFYTEICYLLSGRAIY